MGTVAWDMINPEMIMIGTKNGLTGSDCKARSELLESFYNVVCDNIPRMEFGTWEEVEAMKIFYNTFISNKVALVNMIQDVAHRMGNMDVDTVTQALERCRQVQVLLLLECCCWSAAGVLLLECCCCCCWSVVAGVLLEC